MTRVLQDLRKRLEQQSHPSSTATSIPIFYWLPLLDYFEYAVNHNADEFPIWVGRLRFLRRDSFQLIESSVVITCFISEWNPGMIPRVDGIPEPTQKSESEDDEMEEAAENLEGRPGEQQQQQQRQPPPPPPPPPPPNQQQQQQRQRPPFLQQGRVYVLRHWDKIVLWDPRREGMNYVFPYLDNLRFASIQMHGADESASRRSLKCHWKSNDGDYRQWSGAASVEMLISQLYSTMKNLRTLGQNMGTEAFYECGLWTRDMVID